MKNIYNLILVSIVLFLHGCADDLDRLPLDELVEETTFTTNANFATYSWGFYNVLNTFDIGYVNRDFNSDVLVRSNNNNGENWLHQRITVPTNSGDWTNPYVQIRRVNIMLARIETSALSAQEQLHWRSVGLFFRSIAYFDLLRKYGGVPWIEGVVTDTDVDILNAPRDSRDVVAANILRDLTYAVANIREDGSSDNSVDTDVVNAFLSRFSLFEGAWRKYHGLGGEDAYYRASVNASEAVMAGNSLHGNYEELFNSPDLSNKNGVILYRQHVENVFTHIVTSRHRNSAGNWDLTKKAADMYLYKDGTPVGANPDFVGGAMLERDPYTEFRDRDERMLVTVLPPFKVNRVGGNNVRVWEHTGNSADREYIDLVNSLVGGTTKKLPTSNWTGFIVAQSPHFRNFNNGQGYNVTRTGYKSFKYFDELNTGIQNRDYADAPIFRLAEVLLNYAEAKFELGEFSQTIATQTISALRARGSVAALNLSNITIDPRRDAEIDPILWEIRRERAIEFMFEGGFRWDDLRRWKKMDYAAEKKLGRYIVRSDYGNKLPVDGGGTEGYVSFWPTPPAYLEYYYLYPIPSNQIVLNPQIVQNPNWE